MASRPGGRVATRQLDWYFDFVSPFAYLQSRRLGELPPGVSVRRRPVLFAGLLRHWSHKGPAEIAPKRRFTYRYLQWYCQHHGVPFRMPPAHPFNPLAALRLAVALDGEPAAVDTIFRYIWAEGGAVDTPEGWRALAGRLGLPDAGERAGTADAKAGLRANTEEAARRGVFGVPTFVTGEDELFWGDDATPMLLDWLAHPGAFDTPEMARVSALPVSSTRRGQED